MENMFVENLVKSKRNLWSIEQLKNNVNFLVLGEKCIGTLCTFLETFLYI